VLKASNVWGPYTAKAIIDKTKGPIAGGGVPHQGAFLQTQKGDWYYMGFQDAFPGGRVPVLAPVTWSADGWPSVTLVGGAWAASYPYPDVPRPPHATKPQTGKETFSGTTLAPEWEWNHNPDNTKWSAGSGLRLQTATVTGGERAGLSVAGLVAAEIDEWNRSHESRGDSEGRELGSIGVVLGATKNLLDYGVDALSLGQATPLMPVLAPGFGHQGARFDDMPSIYGPLSAGTVVSTSRAALAAGPSALRDTLADQAAQLAGAMS
jgi:hypothetical protein